MKYAWIARHKTQWPITLACEVLEVSASGYFEHRRRKDSDTPNRPGATQRMGDEALLIHIKAIHTEFKEEYGWPKMWKELQARGIRVGKERVRLLMQRNGINLPFGSGQPIVQPWVSRRAQGLWNAILDEPQGQLLGQCAN